MIDVTPPPPSPFTVGDKVVPVESADDHLALNGTRSRPGVIRRIDGGSHLVLFDWAGVALPYPARDLELAT